MGVCGSKPEGCIGRRFGLSEKKNRRRRRSVRRRVSSRKLEYSVSTDRSYANPTFQAAGSVEAAWFDSISVIDSECDDEFYSVRDDMMSLNGSEYGPTLSFSSLKHVNLKEHVENASSIVAPDRQKKLKELAENNCEKNSALEVAKNVSMVKAQLKDFNSHQNEVITVLADEVSTVCDGESGRRDLTAEMSSCGLLPNTCLPCLASTSSSVDNRRTSSTGPPSLRKKTLSKLSFKFRESLTDPTLISPKAFNQKPIAGTSVPYCPIEKRMPDCWSPIDSSTFKVRAKNFLRDKKKAFAPNCAAFYPFGVDVFISQRKIDHIARYVELPAMNSAGEVPPMLVVNLQVPLYPAMIFQSENDGEGMSLVMYFKISETYSELPPTFRENITRFINDEVERVRGFPLDNIVPFRERLKILGRVANIDDLHLTATENKVLSASNEKPVLSRPQHEFYLGENYFEIDLDMHRFSYLSRKGFQSFHDKLKHCIFDFGLTIQGTKAEDLPEHILCCVQLNGIDCTKYNRLGI